MSLFRHWSLLLGAVLFLGGNLPGLAGDYFLISVVDEATGRGVPLVELRTINQITYWTDSRGLVAFHEPGLMDQEVFFHVKSHGYEFPKDGFGNRGTRFKTVPGSTGVLKIKRLNIAERLYRITGQGIYRDTILAGQKAPILQPVSNGQVLGQDTVIVTPYRGKLYWFYGDTEKANYPIGNYGVSGATSPLPFTPGADPAQGIDLTYFVNAAGFSRPMCPDLGPGLQWIEGVMVIPDESGRDRLVARVSSQKGVEPAYAWHLVVFNDEKEVFESVVKWDLKDPHDSSHPFYATVNGKKYVYLYPNYRVPANLAAMKDLRNYEAFTCLAGDGKPAGSQTSIDRDEKGRAKYSWKAGAERMRPGSIRMPGKWGGLKREEWWMTLHDLETGNPVEADRGSVYWNEHRRRWVSVMKGRTGEVWFAEADTPTGPWVYARRILTHDQYNFYNPTQHPFFDQEKGRIIYFEGTYTASFSGAKEKTPRYEYNQVMYRLDLEDPRLQLPAPVYYVPNPSSGSWHWREGIQQHRLSSQIDSVPFLALPPSQKPTGLIPIFLQKSGTNWILTSEASAPNTPPLFLALPLQDTAASKGFDSSAVAPLYEFVHESGERYYSTEVETTRKGFKRKGEPLGRVWKNPAQSLALDWNLELAL